jgi:hypothetical protein
MNQGDEGVTDEEVVAGLQGAIRAEGVPPEVVAAAKAAFTWRTIDAELAALTFDSLDERELAGVRSGGGPRALTFEAGGAVIEVEVGGLGATRRLEGQVVPSDVERLELQHVDTPDGRVLPIDDLGRFHADGIRPGRLRLVCRFLPAAGGATLLTEWVQI